MQISLPKVFDYHANFSPRCLQETNAVVKRFILATANEMHGRGNIYGPGPASQVGQLRPAWAGRAQSM